MKRNEIIELNGVEYTLELNRESFLQIDKICNVDKAFEIINRSLYEYEEDIDDDYNPLENTISDEELENEIELKTNELHKLIEKSFFIWLYPNHKLPISKVREILEPYFEDEEKAKFISEKAGTFLKECISIRQQEIDERKNLKAQINKK